MQRRSLTAYQMNRLRLLAEKPRAYTTRDGINPRLERLGLVRDTGKHDPVRGLIVWEITDDGRSVLKGSTDA